MQGPQCRLKAAVSGIGIETEPLAIPRLLIISGRDVRRRHLRVPNSAVQHCRGHSRKPPSLGADLAAAIGWEAVRPILTGTQEKRTLSIQHFQPLILCAERDGGKGMLPFGMGDDGQYASYSKVVLNFAEIA